ncbi:MAG: divergent polysaccharide deacetylase family protein [Candidatus Poribacteria bacterium]|nr:divergent polysaccharide deacetylase family protein [Candidatus Poribacteria bacterium]
MKPSNKPILKRVKAVICTSLILFTLASVLAQVEIFSWNGFPPSDVAKAGDLSRTETYNRGWGRLANLFGYAGNAPQIAIIIDDFGYQQKAADLFMALNVPLTFAILPNLSLSTQLAVQAKQQGYEVMLHLPMEPHNAYVNNPGELAIWTYMTQEKIRQMVNEAVDSVPGSVGVNNHMGSKATENSGVMQVLMETLKGQDLFFIDSFTSRNSIAYRTAKAYHIPTARNQVFLDNSKDLNDIKKQIRQLARIAMGRGVAIGIGHAHTNMARALRESLPMLQTEGIQLVFASQVVR